MIKSFKIVGLVLLIWNMLFAQLQAQPALRNLVVNGSFEEAPPYWDTLSENNKHVFSTVNSNISNLYVYNLNGWSSCVSPTTSGGGAESGGDTCCQKKSPYEPYDKNAHYFDLLKFKKMSLTSLPNHHPWYDAYAHIKTRMPNDTLHGKNVGFITLQTYRTCGPSDGMHIAGPSGGSSSQGNFRYSTSMTNTFKEPLKPGKKYKIGFFAGIDNWVDTTNIPKEPYKYYPEYFPHATARDWLRPAMKEEGDYTSYLTDGLGILLGKSDLVCYATGHGSKKYPMSEYPPQFRIPSPHMSKGEWVEYNWEFVADIAHETMTIGNFWDTSQQNIIKWPFDYYSDYKDELRNDFGAPPDDIWWRYRFMFMYMFIDSVYLYEIGSYLPEDTTICWGDNIEIKENLGRVVLWYREDGSSFTSDVFTVVADKPVSRVVAYIDGEYDTMYVYGKSPAIFTIAHTDSLCIYQGRPYNTFKIISSEPELQGKWIQWGNIHEGLEFNTRDTGMFILQVIDSVGCVQDTLLESELFCICPVLPPDTVLCINEQITLKDLIGCDITWILEDGSQVKDPELTFTVTKPIHKIKAESDGNYDSMYVYGKQMPDYEIKHTDSLCFYTRKEFNRLQLLLNETGVVAFWTVSDKISTGTVFESSDTGLVYILIEDSVGCQYYDTFYLGEYCPDFSEICAFPTAFSPNGDGLNDVLNLNCVNISSVQATILNRWGEVITMSTDVNHIWDGSYKSKPAPDGVYTMVLQYEVYTRPGKKYYYSGTVTLIR